MNLHRMSRPAGAWLALAVGLAGMPIQAAPKETVTAVAALTVGVAQLSIEQQLLPSRDKVAKFVRLARERRCRVVVFPRTALNWPPHTAKHEIDSAIEHLQKVVEQADLYVIIVCLYKRHESEKPFERLLVINPDGRVVHTYDHLWHDPRFNDAPGLFEIDSMPCGAAISSDRWVRSVEELPVMAGARILFECSNDFDNEWVPELGWHRQVPRALRNDVFVVFANTARERGWSDRPGYGRSAIFAPNGDALTWAGDEADKLLVATLDLAQATGAQAQRRRAHPLFREFWETGVAMLGGEKRDVPAFRALVAPEIEVTIAAVQMPCSRKMHDNVAKIVEAIRAAGAQHADVVVFPELALTGALEDDIAAATQPELELALGTIQQAAREMHVYVACGMPWNAAGRRYNCAVIVDPEGTVLTRYAQVVVDRPELFTSGDNTQAMWFDLRGVPCVVTVGHDDLWSEIAEMAALRGAQMHLHLAYDRDTSAAGRLRRKQLWVNMASFRTFTATVNAASPAGVEHPSAPATGESAIWEDFYRASGRWAGGYAPHSAVRLATASQDETILYATQMIQRSNQHFQRLTGTTNPQMTAWYATGAKDICAPAKADRPASKQE